LRFADNVVNLGEITGGPRRRVSLEFKNTGPEIVEILEMRRGCGCLAPRLEKRRYLPGEKGTLILELRTLGQANGPHTWTAQVLYRAGNQTAGIPLEIRARVQNEVTLQPAALAFHTEGSLQQEVVLTDSRPSPVRVQHLETTSPHLAAKLVAQENGVAKILVEAQISYPPGRHEEILSVYTSDPAYSHLEVPVTVVKAAQKAVTAVPERIEIRAVPGQPPAAALVRLRPRGDTALVIERVQAGDAALTCTVASGPDKAATLKIQVDLAQLAEKNCRSEVRVFLREPQGEVVVIPVTVAADTGP
jgi:hypothetical protein